jgi:hypothetical protein
MSSGAEKSMEQNILRAGNGSNVIELAGNYSAGGVYVFHGDADSTVPVRFARQMRQILGTFQNDFCYYEYPGGSHWWGASCADWPPPGRTIWPLTLKSTVRGPLVLIVVRAAPTAARVAAGAARDVAVPAPSVAARTYLELCAA